MSTTTDDLLRDVRVVESCYCRTELTAPWGLDSAACDAVTFHFVAQGRCWFAADGEARWLDRGDLVVLPNGAAHLLADEPDPAPAWVYHLPRVGKDTPTLRHGGGGQPALLLCGGAKFDPPELPVVRLLPDVLHLSETHAAIGPTLDVIALEASRAQPGADAIIARLCDVLILQAVRAWLERAGHGPTGPMGALTDERIARAIGLMHRHPDRPWSVRDLAAAVHMSRASFAERFTALVGVGPIAFLTRHRMDLATVLMRATAVSRRARSRRASATGRSPRSAARTHAWPATRPAPRAADADARVV